MSDLDPKHVGHVRTDPACVQHTETTDETRGIACQLCGTLDGDSRPTDVYLRPSLTVPCPRCNAGVGEECRALTTGRRTDTHMPRYDVLAAKRRRGR